MVTPRTEIVISTKIRKFREINFSQNFILILELIV